MSTTHNEYLSWIILSVISVGQNLSLLLIRFFGKYPAIITDRVTLFMGHSVQSAHNFASVSPVKHCLWF